DARGGRRRRDRVPDGGHRADPRADPRRHGRGATERAGPPDSEHIHWRPRFPLGQGVGLPPGHVRRGGRDRAPGGGVDTTGVRGAGPSPPARRFWRVNPPFSGSLASVDGAIMLASGATIPATDEGLLRGDGVFEVIRVYDGRPFAM